VVKLGSGIPRLAIVLCCLVLENIVFIVCICAKEVTVEVNRGKSVLFCADEKGLKLDPTFRHALQRVARVSFHITSRKGLKQ
jgi:hypothetical protein